MQADIGSRVATHEDGPVAWLADGKRATYGGLAALAQRVASALLGAGESLAGERVALMIGPGAAFVAAMHGVWLAGGCAVVLSPLHPAAESAFFCADANVRTILVSPHLVEKLGDAVSGRRVVPIGEALSTATDRRFVSPDANADALQLYTSGTTGKPKGAVLTHHNLAMQQRLVGEAWTFSANDVLLHSLPLHHMHGLAIAMFTALGAGATIRFLEGFDAKRIWEEMRDATVFMGVPTMYTRLVEAYEAADSDTRARWQAHARALRLCTSGSAALPVPLAEKWEAIAGVIPVERFGMTEIGVGMTNALDRRKKGFVGAPLPTVETRIVGEDGNDADVGELWIRGPSVFRGYWQREDATREAFTPAKDGGAHWFKTGDTVTRDQDGDFRIMGRTSVDILKSGGYKLSALEIESAILELGVVREVAVVGLPDETWGDRVVACVVPAPGREADCATEALRNLLKQNLAHYKCPREVRIFASLPRNAMGKVVKPELVKLL